jgi:hypothetical protein
METGLNGKTLLLKGTGQGIARERCACLASTDSKLIRIGVAEMARRSYRQSRILRICADGMPFGLYLYLR